MKFELKQQAIEDLEYLKKHNKAAIQRIKALHRAILEDPFGGIGKPEHLKYDLSGKWSRRVNQRDRLVYEVFDDRIVVYQYRYHY